MRATLILFTLISPLLSQAQDTESLPKELATLQQEYLKAINAATQLITNRHIQDLTNLQKKYTMAGDLNAALAVKGILDDLARNTQDGKKAPTTLIGPSRKELIATLDGTRWSGTWQYGDITFTFQGETVIVDAGTKWEHQGQVKVTSVRELTITVQSNVDPRKPPMVHTLEVSKDGLTMSGTREISVTKKP